MHFDRLQFTGKNAARYELGEPLHVADRGVHLGVLDPVRVTHNGTQVHISRFVAAPIVKDEHRNFGPLVLLELTSFIAENFQSVQSISFFLSREIETYGNGMKVASARSQLLQDMGAEGVTVRPKPDSTVPGNFVVRGEWSYSEGNLAALAACLQRERDVYRALDKTVSLEPGLRGRLRGMLLRDDRNGA